MLLLAMTIIKKYKRALENEKNSREYFEQLSETPTPEQLASWEAEISNAEARRTDKPSAMDVMATRIPKGRLALFRNPMVCVRLIGTPALTLAQKRLELVESQERGVSGETTWIIAGLKLEEQQ